ncbi:MAG TPA: hypothetical protein VEU08_02380 [Vicinamibacterales bacterium]|nr:hypothetical protein [Vicinamibacterales bacterium]
MSQRDLLLAAVSLPREAVSIPELGETFTVQGMNGLQRDDFEASLFSTTANGRRRVFTSANIRAKLLVRCVIDPETGDRLFSDGDADAVGQIRADVLDRLFAVAQRLSGIRDEDVEALAKK